MSRPLVWRALGAAALLAAAAGAQDTQGFGDYELMDFEAQIADFDSATFMPKSFTGNAMIRFKPADPAEPAMEVRAETIDFEQDSGGEIALVDLSGGVYLSRAGLEIEAERGTWQRTTNSFDFTGSPVTVTLEGGQRIQGSRITYDTESGTYRILQGRGENIPIRGTDGASATLRAYLLSPGDVTDWAALIEAIQAEYAGGEPSPGRHMLSLMNEEMQAIFMGLPPDPAPPIQKQIAGQVNKLLMEPDFYDAEAFAGVQLGSRTGELLERDELGDEERAERNRLLLEAAYPGAIAPMGGADGEEGQRRGR